MLRQLQHFFISVYKGWCFSASPRSFHSLPKLVPQCYTICLFYTMFLVPDHRDPAVVKPLWSFHRGIWQNVSSISINGVKGFGKKLSNPCKWHHHLLHPLSLTCGQKLEKKKKLFLFGLYSSWLSNATQSLLLRWESRKHFLLAAQIERRKCRVRATSGTDQTKQTEVVSIFWNERSQNNLMLNDIAKLFALRVLEERIAKHYLTRKSTPRWATRMPGKQRNFT